MEEQGFDISELVARKMSQPVKSKDGRVIVNDDGNPMTIMEAIATTIVQNAMKGDSASILLVRNITKKTSTKEDVEKANKEYGEKVAYYKRMIVEELKQDGLWYGDMTEIELAAMTMCDIERVERIMQLPDTDDLITDIRKDGTQSRYINPLHPRLDELKDQLKRLKAIIVQRQSERKKKGIMSKGIEF